jgi:hypothetical protein
MPRTRSPNGLAEPAAESINAQHFQLLVQQVDEAQRSLDVLRRDLRSIAQRLLKGTGLSESAPPAPQTDDGTQVHPSPHPNRQSTSTNNRSTAALNRN